MVACACFLRWSPLLQSLWFAWQQWQRIIGTVYAAVTHEVDRVNVQLDEFHRCRRHLLMRYTIVISYDGCYVIAMCYA